MDAINGVTLEKYADLCALMANTGGDEAKEIEIAEANRVNAADWKAAKAGFTAKMMDPTDMGKTAMAFMPLLQAAQTKLRGGGEPCELQLYATIKTHMAFEKDPADRSKKLDFNLILARYNFPYPKWLECENYWGFKVGDNKHPEFVPELGAKFNEYVTAENKKMEAEGLT